MMLRTVTVLVGLALLVSGINGMDENHMYKRSVFQKFPKHFYDMQSPSFQQQSGLLGQSHQLGQLGETSYMQQAEHAFVQQPAFMQG
ncbi:hypothetical protein MTO96_048024 [Rhipicephalus appendiculatus]